MIISGYSTIVPFIKHYGILLEKGKETFVLHNTPFRGTVKDSYKQFTKNHYKIRVEPSPLSGKSADYVEYMFSKCQGKYHLTKYNCEHFIACMTGQDRTSPQLKGYEKAGLATAILLLVFTRKK